MTIEITMATSIQVSHELKDRLKEYKSSQTYEEFITKLLHEHTRTQVAKHMREYATNNDTQKEVHEWKHTETAW
jgi:hypothetical protein